MRTVAQKPKVTQQTAPARSTLPSQVHESGSKATASPLFAHDLSGISIHAPGAATLQTKLRVNSPGDAYEQEANRVADQVLAAPANSADSVSPPRIERFTGQSFTQQAAAPASIERVLTSPGQALGPSLRQQMEQGFGHDFSRVRVHSGGAAGQSANELNAHAYTVGHHIVFGTSQFAPHTQEGRRLLAHELSHVVQQRGQHGLIQCDGPTEAEKKTKLITELVAAYALAGVADGTGKWTSEHLQQVSDGLKLVPAGDRKALKNVTLSRVTSLGGTTTGRFSASQSVTATTVINEATLELADLAFKDGAPASHSVIVHEVGHAVATLALRTAKQAKHVAIAESNRLAAISNSKLDLYKTAVKSREEAIDPVNDASIEYDAARKSGDAGRIATAKADYENKKAEYETRKAEATRLERSWKTADAKTVTAKADEKKKGVAAQKKRITAKDLVTIKKNAKSTAAAHKKKVAAAKSKLEAMSTAAKTESSTYRSALEAASLAITDFAVNTKDQTLSEDDVETAVKVVQKALGARDTQRKTLTGVNKDNAALSILSPVEQAQNTWFDAAKAHSLAHQRNVRVQKFVKFVESKKIAPITTYAAENWPHKPEEFYAEAYSMFFVKPKDLEIASAALYKWFKAGKYR